MNKLLIIIIIIYLFYLFIYLFILRGNLGFGRRTVHEISVVNQYFIVRKTCLLFWKSWILGNFRKISIMKS